MKLIMVALCLHVTCGLPIVNDKSRFCSVIDCNKSIDEKSNSSILLKCESIERMTSVCDTSLVATNSPNDNNTCISTKDEFAFSVGLKVYNEITTLEEVRRTYKQFQQRLTSNRPSLLAVLYPAIFSILVAPCQNSIIFLIYPALSQMIQLSLISNNVLCDWNSGYRVQLISYNQHGSLPNLKQGSRRVVYKEIEAALIRVKSQIEKSCGTKSPIRSRNNNEDDKPSKYKVTIVVPVVIICFVVFSCVLIMRFCHDGESSLMIQAKVMKYHPEKDKQLLSIIYKQIHKETAEAPSTKKPSRRSSRALSIHTLSFDSRSMYHKELDVIKSDHSLSSRHPSNNNRNNKTSQDNSQNKQLEKLRSIKRDDALWNEPCCSKNMCSASYGIVPTKK